MTDAAGSRAEEWQEALEIAFGVTFETPDEFLRWVSRRLLDAPARPVPEWVRSLRSDQKDRRRYGG